jgi:hypothetical protein
MINTEKEIPIRTTLQLEAILLTGKNEHLLKNFLQEGVDDTVLPSLTDTDLRDIGISKIGDRRRLLAAFAKLRMDERLAESTPMPQATAAEPFINSIGLPFVAIPGFQTLVCAWPVRVRDYRLYCEEKSLEFPDQKHATNPTHPVVNVTWHECIDFCVWLTAKERASGLMGADQFYRMLTDLEWSASVGLPNESEPTPADRSKKLPGYPWGPTYPPPKGAGNYDPSLKADDFDFTSPVDAFAPNALGIYDLSGNVWEWCMDNFNASRTYHTLRGGAWDLNGSGLMSSARNANDPNVKSSCVGFRIAFAMQEGPGQKTT